MKIARWIRESNLIEGVDDPEEDKRSQLAWQWFRKQELTVRSILDLHGRIMKEKLGEEAGRFRTCQVWVGGREGAPWSHIPMLMGLWVRKWRINAPTPQEAIEEYIKLAHVDFEKIHPLIDGNGRTGRMVFQWQRVKAGLEPLLIEAEKRGSYYEWFR